MEDGDEVEDAAVDTDEGEDDEEDAGEEDVDDEDAGEAVSELDAQTGEKGNRLNDDTADSIITRKALFPGPLCI